MRIKNAGGGLNNGDSLVVSGEGEQVLLLVLNHSHELQTDVLGMHLGCEAVGQRLLFAAGDLQAITLASKVAQDVRLVAGLLDQRSADDGDSNRLGLLVVDGQPGLGRVAVDQFDAEDLSLRKAGLDGDLEVGRLGLLALDDLFDILDLDRCRQWLMSCMVKIAGSHLNCCKGIEGAKRQEEQRR